MKRFLMPVLVLLVLAGCGVIRIQPPPPAHAAFNRGMMLERRSDWAGALRQYDSARTLDPNFRPGRVMWRQGICYYRLGQLEPAAAALDAAIAADQFRDTREPFLLLIEIRIALKQPDLALAVLDRVLALQGTDPWLWDRKMNMLLSMGKVKEAREAALRAEAAAFASATPGNERLSLPFEGTWKVLSGNSDGGHWGLAMKYAWDFVRIDKRGRTRDAAAGSARANGSYYAWNQPILAPADGVVVVAEGGVEDNKRAGTPNAAAPYGNHVIIRHPSGEMTMIAHLRAGTLTVKVGDQVVRGRELGKCGNSGYALQPMVTMIAIQQLEPRLCRPARIWWYSAPMAGPAVIEGGVPETGEIIRAEKVPPQLPPAAAPAPASAGGTAPAVAAPTVPAAAGGQHPAVAAPTVPAAAGGQHPAVAAPTAPAPASGQQQAAAAPAAPAASPAVAPEPAPTPASAPAPVAPAAAAPATPAATPATPAVPATPAATPATPAVPATPAAVADEAPKPAPEATKDDEVKDEPGAKGKRKGADKGKKKGATKGKKVGQGGPATEEEAEAEAEGESGDAADASSDASESGDAAEGDKAKDGKEAKSDEGKKDTPASAAPASKAEGDDEAASDDGAGKSKGKAKGKAKGKKK